MISIRGSEWRKWDFHIHTPYSLLNNGFGINPYDENRTSFDRYVYELFSRAVADDVYAIGITDYFCISGYKRIRTEYLENEEKLIQLFPDDEMRRKIRSIFVFPNIEMRINSFVGKKSDPVGYHVIFSDEVSIDDIEENFLHKVNVIYSVDNDFTLTESSVRRIGADYKKHNGVDGDDYAVGLAHIAVAEADVRKVLSNGIFAGKYIISIPVDESLSTVSWTGRDYGTRRMLYQQCQCLMSSNPRTREWALAKGREKAQIDEFHSIKPCIWGSDAHSFERLFKPDGNRYCWVKADTTFEGMKQILFEPDDRIRIQPTKPEEKDPHHLIDFIRFSDEQFQSDPIYFSEGLTCIIGGKSTGKTLLLSGIASVVAPDQVNDRKTPISSRRAPLTSNIEVVWRDGTSGKRKLVYIPQSWLNQIVEEKGGETELNKLIHDILIQQDDIDAAEKKLRSDLEDKVKQIKANITNYGNAIKRAAECENLLQTHGRSESFLATIEQLSKERDSLSSTVGITPETLKRYSELEERLRSITHKITALKQEKTILEFCGLPFIYVPGYTTLEDNGSATYSFESVPTVKNELEEAIARLNTAVQETWQPACEKALENLSSKVAELEESLDTIHDEYDPLKDQIALNDQLKAIDERLAAERKKLDYVKQIEDEKACCAIKATELQTWIINSRTEIQSMYEEFCSVVNRANRDDTSLEFGAELDIKKRDLFSALTVMLDNRGFRQFKDKYAHNLLDLDDFEICDSLFSDLWTALSNNRIYGGLSLKGSNTINDFLEKVFGDWYHVRFTVKSGGDTVNDMSPGKKALVLLELIIYIEKGNCPILIDQPEDDLDNRSIYSDLVQYIKQKKHERQIIVVTHNANVVVGADAEEVIIANQEGFSSPNNSKRFEYRCGAIENVSPVIDETGNPAKGILNQQGIQQQICDILEGGMRAFELRRSKYSKIETPM